MTKVNKNNDWTTVEHWQIGEKIVGFALVKNYSWKTATNNKLYLDLILASKNSEINAKVWSISQEIERIFVDEKPKLVKVSGTVLEWQGKSQLKVERIRLAVDDDDVNINDFVATAPYEPIFMYKKIHSYVDSMQDQELKLLTTKLLEDVREQLLYYPAAKSNHHAIRSGLLYHILTMLRVGEGLVNIYSQLDADLLYAGIVLHDLAKIEEMDANDLGIVANYTTEGNLLGHIIQGIKKVDAFAKELNVTPEKALLLQHMILSHHNYPEYGSPKPPMIPEAELLHHIDMIDSRMYDMEKALQETEPGSFTERIWSMNNRTLYKRS